MDELRERLNANLAQAKVAMEAADPFPITASGWEHPGFAVASRRDDAAVKIARQLRLAGEELPADVEDPFADLVARRKEVE